MEVRSSPADSIPVMYAEEGEDVQDEVQEGEEEISLRAQRVSSDLGENHLANVSIPNGVIHASPDTAHERSRPFSSVQESSERIAEKLMSGWTMLGEACPACASPLMRDRQSVLHCVVCGTDLGHGPGLATTPLTTPAIAQEESRPHGNINASIAHAAGVGSSGPGTSFTDVGALSDATRCACKTSLDLLAQEVEVRMQQVRSRVSNDFELKNILDQSQQILKTMWAIDRILGRPVLKAKKSYSGFSQYPSK
eukprot:CAMPEP_0184684682 /NCGR_PEP_ID=MMETSP0312-20130426/16292_1 /TAXON_ID=31354 /ORGANISM="Compsopogon coeruleus, Strain SAG 36.94" /LENGTH=251 /DNA_ID=CAMNT_0027138113 /DNA_START=168 /DNA_END=923 /DNA_ORIENTATION=+